jgi:uncharacterized membrane protein
MATLTAIKFPTPEGADRAINTLKELQRQQLITVHDAAVVSWPADKSKPKTRQANSLVGAGALGGMFWGMLFGLLFLVPILGAAIGAGIGALTASLADVGIDDKFINEVKSKVTPGTSALFALTSDAVMDRVVAAFQGMQGEIMSTNLSQEQENELRDMFAEQAAAQKA